MEPNTNQGGGMNVNNMNNMDMGQMQSGGMMPHKEKSVGPVVSIIVILIILVLGGLYMFGSKNMNADKMMKEGDNMMMETQPAEDQAISEELDNLDLNIDAEIDQIGVEITTQ